MSILEAPHCEQCSVFLCLVNIGPLSPRLLPHKWGSPTPKWLVHYLIHLKLGYFLLVQFLYLLKLSSQSKRMKYELNIRHSHSHDSHIPFSKIIIKILSKKSRM